MNTEKIYKKVISNEVKNHQICKIDEIRGKKCPIIIGISKDQEIAILPCNHVFDKVAIDEWLEKNNVGVQYVDTNLNQKK